MSLATRVRETLTDYRNSLEMDDDLSDADAKLVQDVAQLEPDAEKWRMFADVIKDGPLSDKMLNWTEDYRLCKHRLDKVKAVRESLYKTYADDSRKPPNGYYHAIPWFIIDTKLKEALGEPIT